LEMSYEGNSIRVDQENRKQLISKSEISYGLIRKTVKQKPGK